MGQVVLQQGLALHRLRLAVPPTPVVFVDSPKCARKRGRGPVSQRRNRALAVLSTLQP